jgi:outer membrane protein OmpA-like peptidoglycan-associated protein
MHARHLILCALGIAFLCLQMGCSPTTTCGLRPSDFAVPKGAFWDANKNREQAQMAGNLCDQYLPMLDRIRKAEKIIELPEVRAGEGTLALGMGKVELSVEERVNYAVIATFNEAMVKSAIASCQAAMLSYECVVFSDPNNDPRIAGARDLLDRVMQRESLTIKAAAVAAAKDKDAYSQAVKELKEQLQQPVKPASSLPGPEGTTKDPQSTLRPSPMWASDVQVRLDMLQGTLDALYRRVDANIDGLRQISDSFEALRAALKHSGFQLSSFARRIRQLEDMASAKAEADKCVLDAQMELTRVTNLRKTLQSKLPEGVDVEFSDLYGPLVLRTQQDGFAECRAELGEAMKQRLGSLFAALSSAIPREDYGALRIVVHGYSDEQTMISYPFSPGSPNYKKATEDKMNACYSAHKSNIALAEKRAAAVVSYVVSSDQGKSMALTSEKITQIGHDKEFIRTGCGDDACHAQNRRFRIIVDAQTFRFAQPKTC